MDKVMRLAPNNFKPARALSPQLNRRLEQIRQTYNYIYSLVQAVNVLKLPYFIRLAFDEHYDAWAVLVKNSLSLLDKKNRRFLFGVNFEFGVRRLLGDDVPMELRTEDGTEAFDRASRIIAGELKRRFPALGITDVTEGFPYLASNNPRRNVHGHGFYLVIEVPLGSIPAATQGPPASRRQPPSSRPVVAEPPMDLFALLKKRR